MAQFHFGHRIHCYASDSSLQCRAFPTRARTSHQWNVLPPSTERVTPVVYEDSELVRNKMLLAISTGLAMRFNAYRLRVSADVRADSSRIGVSTIPGQIALTRMAGANSIDNALVIASTPPLELA